MDSLDVLLLPVASVLQIILGTGFALACFYISFGARIDHAHGPWSRVLCGLSLFFSIVCFPDSDPASVVIAVPANELTRSFFILALFAVKIAIAQLDSSFGPPTELSDFHFTVGLVMLAAHWGMNMSKASV
jgi:hypothetical protein